MSKELWVSVLLSVLLRHLSVAHAICIMLWLSNIALYSMSLCLFSEAIAMLSEFP